MLLISSDSFFFLLACLPFCLLVLCRCIDSSEVRVVAVYTFVVHLVEVIDGVPIRRGRL